MARRPNITRVLIYTTLCAVLAGVVVLCVVIVYQSQRARLAGSICTKVDSLVLYPPNDASELEWAVLVYWTSNLHGEAMPSWYASYSSLRELDQFLDTTMAGGPNRSTIDGLWDRYASMSDSGLRYRVKYEPIRDEDAAAITLKGEAHANARCYRDFLEGV